MRKWDRELRRIPGVINVQQTNGNHLRLRLTNGRSIVTSATTSNRRVIRNTICQVRRELRRTEPVR